MNITFDYNNHPITFSQKENVMVNATQMAKAFGKFPADWLRQKSTNEFVNALSSDMGIPTSSLIQVVKGGNNEQGTWMHEEVALEFARWLSPQFAIWCNRQIKQLLTTGHTEMIPRTFAEALRLAADQAEMIERQQAKIAEDAPKVEFANAITVSDTTCLIGELAKVLTQNGYEVGQNRLFKILRNEGYLGKSGEYYNIPNQKYVEMGLFKIKKGTRVGSYGEVHTVTTTKVTGKGLQYFINKFLSKKNNTIKK